MSIRIINTHGKIRYEVPGRVSEALDINFSNEEFPIMSDDTEIVLTLTKTPVQNSEVISINGLTLNKNEYILNNNQIHLTYPLREGDLIKVKYL